MLNKKNGLPAYRQRKLISLFCADLTAIQAALVIWVNHDSMKGNPVFLWRPIATIGMAKTRLQALAQ